MLDRYQLKRNRALSIISLFNEKSQLFQRAYNKYNDIKWIRECSVCRDVKEHKHYCKDNGWRIWISLICLSCEIYRWKEYRKNNRELINKSQRKKYNNDTEFRKKKRDDWLIWRDKNREHREQYQKKWNKENKDKIKINSHNSRVKRDKYLKSFSDNTITTESIKEILISQKYLCVDCWINIEDCYTLDHCKSLYDWWAHSITNIQLMCGSCNSKKHTKSYRVVDWEKIYL